MNTPRNEEIKSKIFNIIAKLDNGSHSSNQLQGADEALYELFLSHLTTERTALIEEIIGIISTHSEHEGSYCDTGADMDWSCRSECVQLAIKRLQSHLESGNEEKK